MSADNVVSFPGGSPDPISPNRRERPNRPNRPSEAAKVDGAELLEDLYKHFRRYIVTVSHDDLALLALWTLHTHLADVLPTSPRLLIDSVMPGSGKTTVLEHIQKLGMDPVMMAAISSPALLTRMLADRPRTLLVDEVDRVLDPRGDMQKDLIAILNSGYKQGATRPVLVPIKDGGWQAEEQPTYAPVALAGNSPRLPDDTLSRCLRIVLMPDVNGEAEDSDWELIADEVHILRLRCEAWAEQAGDQVKTARPPLPAGVRGRMREIWAPLARVAAVAGGRWPEIVDVLIERDLDERRLEREEGLAAQPPAVRLLVDIRRIYDTDERDFIPTAELIARLIGDDPEQWGEASNFGKPLTAQRMGRMLVRGYRIHSVKNAEGNRRGYRRGQFSNAWRRMLRSDGSDTSASSGGSGRHTPVELVEIAATTTREEHHAEV